VLKDVDRMLQKRDTRSANPATAFEPRICTFSNSQWHVKAELGNGRWQESSFYLSLISPDCKGTAMIIDELVQPLQRIPGVLVSDVFDFSGIHLWYPVVPFVFFSILSHPFAHPRIWCLFEVYQTICLSRNGRSQGLLLCTSTGVLQEGNAGTDVAVAVARKSLGFAEYVLFSC
jgi:hypothetical protein